MRNVQWLCTKINLPRHLSCFLYCFWIKLGMPPSHNSRVTAKKGTAQEIWRKILQISLFFLDLNLDFIFPWPESGLHFSLTWIWTSVISFSSGTFAGSLKYSSLLGPKLRNFCQRTLNYSSDDGELPEAYSAFKMGRLTTIWFFNSSLFYIKFPTWSKNCQKNTKVIR